ncbi:hypothetical protein ACFQUU_16725 [Herbaspirillum sp. GCM10030257]|uniref:hypothetical protein n=1 Tax=Herbaspirillum sp. GCM10030257 TaxID=3273393 RepID=UPI0036089317
MNAVATTLKSQQRFNVLRAYRARGKHNSDMWLGYSAKMNDDFLFPSAIQYLHWLTVLELNPAVRSFIIEPEIVISYDDNETRGTRLDAIVHLSNGSVEWHEVKAGTSSIHSERSQHLAQAAASSSAGVTYKRYTNDDLTPLVALGVRIQKALCYAEVVRFRSETEASIALYSKIQTYRQGTIGDLCEELPLFDAPVLYGVLVRIAAKGAVRLDLSKTGISRSTVWFAEDMT